MCSRFASRPVAKTYEKHKEIEPYSLRDMPAAGLTQQHGFLHAGMVATALDSACGYAGSAVGPFYCPADGKVYIDLDYFEDMQRELGAEGDFALGYVIAHEVGHHVQNLLGIMGEVTDRQHGASESESNRLSVRLELQADFLAGMWAHYALGEEGYIDSADIETDPTDLLIASLSGNDSVSGGNYADYLKGFEVFK